MVEILSTLSYKKANLFAFRSTIHGILKKITFYNRTTLCPRSLDPFYIAIYYIKWVKTSLTYSTLIFPRSLFYLIFIIFMLSKKSFLYSKFLYGGSYRAGLDPYPYHDQSNGWIWIHIKYIYYHIMYKYSNTQFLCTRFLIDLLDSFSLNDAHV